jgi:hypothetical protein
MFALMFALVQEIFVGDITDKKSLEPAMRNCDALVICTSGVPKLRKRELLKSILSKLIGRQRMPKFHYEQMPEQVSAIAHQAVRITTTIHQKVCIKMPCS